jgi:light-regulated signal transduction histidine kinase (bacteriophytochrome)
VPGVQFDQRLNGGTFYKVEAPRVMAGVSRREGEWVTSVDKDLAGLVIKQYQHLFMIYGPNHLVLRL